MPKSSTRYSKRLLVPASVWIVILQLKTSECHCHPRHNPLHVRKLGAGGKPSTLVSAGRLVELPSST
eukprot:520965-Pyramimonas_sp.AAC.1